MNALRPSWVLDYTTPPPSIPPEQLTSGSRRVYRQSSSPVDPAEYPARARQWIPPSIPPELLASGSRRVSRQGGSPVDPAEYPARAARQWIPPSNERLASGSRRVSHQRGIQLSIPESSSPLDPAGFPPQCPLPVDPAEYPASVEPERLASIRQWPPVSRQSSSPVWFCLMSKRADGNLESKSLGCGNLL